MKKKTREEAGVNSNANRRKFERRLLSFKIDFSRIQEIDVKPQEVEMKDMTTAMFRIHDTTPNNGGMMPLEDEPSEIHVYN